MENETLLEKLAKAEAEIARLKASDSDPVRRPSDMIKRFRELCSDEQECFCIAIFNARQQILSVEKIAMGSLASVEVHPRDVFRKAIRMCGHSLIICHNHPSGDASPSDADIDLTNRLVDAGKLLGVPVLDHIIVTKKDHVSLASIGFMN